MKKTLIIILTSFLLLGCSNDLEDTPEENNNDYEYEETLTFEYLSLTQNSAEREEEITHIVIHFISNVIANLENPYNINDVHGILLNYGLSTHYLIDRDGTIYLSVHENRVAFHAGRGHLDAFPHKTNRLNQYSIGIELLGIGTKEEMSGFLTSEDYLRLNPQHIGFTEEQMIAVNKLINDILRRNPAVLPNREHIIGHDEWALDKPDPGRLFDWSRLDFMN